MKVLIAWIGTQDLDAPTHPEEQTGPICSAIEARSFDRLVLIANQDYERVAAYKNWLIKRTKAAESERAMTQGAKGAGALMGVNHDLARMPKPLEIVVENVELKDPTNIDAIHEIAVDVVERCRQAAAPDIPELSFHLSPGTWAMALVWAILSTTRFPAELLQSSKEGGVQTIEVPFDVSAELLPRIMKSADARLAKFSGGLDTKTFGDLIFRSPAMTRMASKARKAALRNVPILIEGEVGTEKVVVARAIHDFGPRRDKPFVKLNCGGLKSDLLEEMIFGSAERKGALEKASGGTFYLDEVEHLPFQTQARLQEYLDDLTTSGTKNVANFNFDTRIIAASKTPLLDAIAAGNFREELFFGLAVLVLKVPSLRERKGDIGLLIDMLLERINDQSHNDPGFKVKTLAPGARNLLLQRTWIGNLREMENTLRRSAIWSESSQISEEDILDAIFSSPTKMEPQNGILNQPIDAGVDLQEIMASVARHYIAGAIEHAEGNKTTAARLVGLPSYQTLSNWMKKYDIG